MTGRDEVDPVMVTARNTVEKLRKQEAQLTVTTGVTVRKEKPDDDDDYESLPACSFLPLLMRGLNTLRSKMWLVRDPSTHVLSATQSVEEKNNKNTALRSLQRAKQNNGGNVSKPALFRVFLTGIEQKKT